MMPRMSEQSPLTVEAFQRFIRERYYATDAARGTPATFMWFIEEVGELATALHDAAKQDGAATGADANAGGLAAEFADVFAWLCTLANIHNVNLEQALREKYLTGDGPKGHK